MCTLASSCAIAAAREHEATQARESNQVVCLRLERVHKEDLCQYFLDLRIYIYIWYNPLFNLGLPGGGESIAETFGDAASTYNLYETILQDHAWFDFKDQIDVWRLDLISYASALDATRSSDGCWLRALWQLDSMSQEMAWPIVSCAWCVSFKTS